MDETYTCVCGTTALFPVFTIFLRAPRSAVLPPSYWQVRVMMATVSLFRKKALPLVQGYEAKSRVMASTTRTCHLDGYTCADTGWQFPICVTTTVLPCSISTLAQNRKLDAPDRTNSTVGGACVVGCATGPELASGDNFRALTCVSENDGITFLTGYLPSCQGTRCLTSTNSAPIGVSEDCEDVPYRTSCREAWAVGFGSANHTELSCLAIGQVGK